MLKYETFPSRSLAGSSMTVLAGDCSAAMVALEEARLKVIAATPHPRDYIGQEPTYQLARMEHDKIVKALSATIDFYEAKSIHCYGQVKEGSSW